MTKFQSRCKIALKLINQGKKKKGTELNAWTASLSASLLSNVQQNQLLKKKKKTLFFIYIGYKNSTTMYYFNSNYFFGNLFQSLFLAIDQYHI